MKKKNKIKSTVNDLDKKDQEESRSELGLEVTSRDMSSSWYTHGVHIYSKD